MGPTCLVKSDSDRSLFLFFLFLFLFFISSPLFFLSLFFFFFFFFGKLYHHQHRPTIFSILPKSRNKLFNSNNLQNKSQPKTNTTPTAQKTNWVGYLCVGIAVFLLHFHRWHHHLSLRPIKKFKKT